MEKKIKQISIVDINTNVLMENIIDVKASIDDAVTILNDLLNYDKVRSTVCSRDM